MGFFKNRLGAELRALRNEQHALALHGVAHCLQHLFIRPEHGGAGLLQLPGQGLEPGILRTCGGEQGEVHLDAGSQRLLGKPQALDQDQAGLASVAHTPRLFDAFIAGAGDPGLHDPLPSAGRACGQDWFEPSGKLSPAWFIFR